MVIYMKYKIGEVSKMLNISKEMIRYYEKKGALSPARVDDNNYRNYSTMDVFLLMEMIRYQSLEFGIKDISELISNNYMEQYTNHLEKLSEQLHQEINEKLLLDQRVKELYERSKTANHNIGNYWFKFIEEHQMYFLVNSRHENYGKIGMSKEDSKIIFNEKNIPYIESTVVFEDGKEVWYYTLTSSYAKKLGIYAEDIKKLPSAYCLCTVVDMGEIGTFSYDCLRSIYDYIAKNNLVISGNPYGMIIGRGYRNGKFKRIMEIHVPIAL